MTRPMSGDAIPAEVVARDAAEAWAWRPWCGARSAYLEVYTRASDTRSSGWLYRAKKRAGVRDAALNCIMDDFSQVDHAVFLKRYGPSTSLAQWARLLGVAWLGEAGNGRWQGHLQYPDTVGLNQRLAEAGLTAGFRFRSCPSEMAHMEFARSLIKRTVMVATQDKFHFHDTLSHVLGYAMYPPDVVEAICAQFTFLFRVYDDSRDRDPGLQALAERHIIDLMKALDRHSTFSPALVLPKDTTLGERLYLWLVDVLERILLRLSTVVPAASLLRRTEAVLEALEVRQIVGRAYYLDPTFNWLEHRDFDLQTYLGYARLLVRDVRLLQHAMLADACRGVGEAAPALAQGSRRCADELVGNRPPGQRRGGTGAPAVIAWRQALSLRGRMRRHVQTTLKRAATGTRPALKRRDAGR